MNFVEEYRTEDKAGWGEGPWQDEPDKVVWVDPATGLDCMAHRNRSGAWCGYVGVPAGHPAYGQDYDNVDVDCHGGLTFAAGCQETGDPAHGICHVPQEGRPAEVWWLGFDCAHFKMRPYGGAGKGKQRREENLGFELTHGPTSSTTSASTAHLDAVVAETTQLAEQLAQLVP